MIYEKLRNLRAIFKSKPVHGFDGARPQNLRKYIKDIQWLCVSGCWVNVQRSVPKTNPQIDPTAEIKTESWVQWLFRRNVMLSMDKFVYLTGRRHGKSAHAFSFSVHFINYVIWVVIISLNWQQNPIQYSFLMFPDRFALWYEIMNWWIPFGDGQPYFSS
jgi:hypothetical protein